VKAVKAYVGVEVELYSLSILAIDWISCPINATASLLPWAVAEGERGGSEGLEVPMAQDFGCAPELLWTLCVKEQPLGLAGNRIMIPSVPSP
jgi:hypothetical protein